MCGFRQPDNERCASIWPTGMPQFIRPKMLTLRSAFTVVLWPSEILPLFTTSERRALRLSTAEAFFFAGILAASRQAGGQPCLQSRAAGPIGKRKSFTSQFATTGRGQRHTTMVWK